MEKISDANSAPVTETIATTSPLFKEWDIGELRYSFVWEDVACLLAAIPAANPWPKRILSIGSAGDNAIGLLASGADEITVIDLSPAQLALAELKRAGLIELTFHEFQELFWGRPGANAKVLVARCRHHLTASADEYWLRNMEALEAGVHRFGRLDRYFEKFREQVLPRIWSADTFAKMIQSTSLDEQMALWASGDREILHSRVGDFFSKTALSQEGRHGSQFTYVEQEDLGPEFLKRFNQLISTQRIAENPYLSYFLTGRPGATKFYPLWNEESFANLSPRANRIRFVCQDLESFLDENPGTDKSSRFDFINLSDLFEYLSADQAQTLFSQLEATLNDGGRLAYWSLLVQRHPANASLHHVTFEVSDRTWFYSQFSVYEKR